MKLVIVESPTKCHTIKQFLGKDYEVIASKGHIRDLAISGKGGLGVDIENDFKPTYVINKDKTKTVKDLLEAKKEAEEVYLATDPDREGEAISWHLASVLDLDVNTTKRLEFHEITKKAVIHALDNPRTIDMDLVSSQETRRIIDRIMGFELSTLLKKKIHSLSAGRVQSVTLKLITDKEKEVQAFVPEEYYTISSIINDVEAKLDSYQNEEITIKTKEEAEKIIDSIRDKKYVVTKKKVVTRKIEPKLPFRTSSLQQEAFNRYHFSTKATQSYAQKLFELGLITYIRTEGNAYAEEFVEYGKKFVEDKYGKEYLNTKSKYENLTAKDNSTLAHEAIRPTSLENTPSLQKSVLDDGSYKLYKLIYEHSLASLMAPKVEEVITVYFDCLGYGFKTESISVKFKGFLKATSTKEEQKENKSVNNFVEQGEYESSSIKYEQHFTKGPTRFNEAKLVKMMEELGIGRPSTYAPTISTLLERDYIKSEKGILYPTDQGNLTIERLASYFPEFMDTSFTAKMEKDLDDIRAHDGTREKVLNSFYSEFEPLYIKAKEEMPGLEVVYSSNTCPKCGKPLVFRKSSFGEFEACSGFPKCKYILKKEEKPLELSSEICPKCGKPLVLRKSKKGEFLACSGYPSCRFIKGEEEQVLSDEVCPKCGKPLILRHSKKGEFLACSGYPTCHYIKGEEPSFSDKKCPKCGSLLVLKKGKRGKGDFLACSSFPKCRYIESIEKKEE